MSLRHLLIDARPLRESPAFRRLWLCTGLSSIGNQMTVLAVTLQVYSLKHSSVGVGAIGLIRAVPAIALALLGGTIGDAVDRRKLVLALVSAKAGTSLVFVAQAFAGLHELWLLYALVATQFLLGSINAPAAQTFMPRLLPKELFEQHLVPKRSISSILDAMDSFRLSTNAASLGLTPRLTMSTIVQSRVRRRLMIQLTARGT